jgi:hypothetical protein
MAHNHYLITRFNIPFCNFLNDKRGAEVRSPRWLEQRFLLFESYCLPSIKNQTNQNFKWLVFFDAKTPENYKIKIGLIARDFPKFKPIYIFKGDEFLPKLQTIIKSENTANNHIITSRVDNDDALHKKYIETIQEIACLHPAKDLLLNFKWGVQLDLSTDLLYQSKDESNPFISRSCQYNNINVATVFDFGHHEASKFLPLKQILNTKGWLVIIHDSNMINTIGGKPLWMKTKILDDYGVSKGTQPIFLIYLKELCLFYFKALKAKLQSL